MSKKISIYGNWKMNLSPLAAASLAESLIPVAAKYKSVELAVAPTYLALTTVTQVLRNSPIIVGAQNVHWEEKGAFTGEISAGMLQEVGCKFALVGHSERRHVFAESIELCTKRALGALNRGFKIIFCVGETLAEREAGQTLAVIQAQLKPLLDQVTDKTINNLVIAYEPVWAIGTGKIANQAEIGEVFTGISTFWEKSFESQGRLALPQVLYGGSVDPSNLEGILKVPLVRGALVGGASLDAAKFAALAEIAAQA